MEKIYIRPVDKNHYVSLGLISEARMPREAAKFLVTHRLNNRNINNAIIATCQGELIGFFRYHPFNYNIEAVGTWVSPKFRRKGISTRMWKLARKRIESKKIIHVGAGSYSGHRFLTSVANKVKGVDYVRGSY